MSNIVDKKIDKFFSQFPSKTFSQGEIILRPEQVITDIYFIKTGKVRMYSITPDGEEVTLHIFRPRSFFPVMMVLRQAPIHYYFESLEKVTTFKAPSPQVIDLLKTEPDVLLDLTARFSDAIRGLLVRVETLASDSAYKRLVHLLLYLSDRFGQKEGTHVVISLAISHEDISNWIGLRRETVSRQVEKLKDHKLVIIEKKKLTILDMTKLKETLSQEL